MDKIKVLVVDDQYVVRELFAYCISTSDKYVISASLKSASLTESYLENNKIDLVIMDIVMMDGSNGLVEAEKIKKKYPNIKIIVITSLIDGEILNKARSIGIDSFWHKEISKDTIIEIMDKTMAGEHIYPSNIPGVMIGDVSSDELTEKELEVLRLMTRGYSNTVIADKLFISENTVKTHIKHMLQKTGCNNRTELAIRARVSGIAIDIED